MSHLNSDPAHSEKCEGENLDGSEIVFIDIRDRDLSISEMTIEILDGN